MKELGIDLDSEDPDSDENSQKTTIVNQKEESVLKKFGFDVDQAIEEANKIGDNYSTDANPEDAVHILNLIQINEKNNEAIPEKLLQSHIQMMNLDKKQFNLASRNLMDYDINSKEVHEREKMKDKRLVDSRDIEKDCIYQINSKLNNKQN